MDIFRRILGLPPTPPRDERTPHFIPPLIDEYEDEDQPEEAFAPGPGINSQDPMMFDAFQQMEQDFGAMERQMRDVWSTFGHSLFSEDFKKMFEEFTIAPSMIPERESTLSPALPEKEPATLREHMFKPNLQSPNTSPGQRKDQDLDSLVREEGVGALFDDQKKITTQRRNPNSFFQFKSITMQSVVRPDGSVEHRRVERDSDGNETVTITEVPPQGHQPPGPDPFFNPSYPQREGDSFLSKLFRR